ncbi:Siderophore synthetase component [Promicromonospora umidemergens]|uniref:Lysine N-acyltransferase MbtK n=1 Tax=Promicromonospora umidemergens TaxID=629679 RepID=A0ABP8XMJ8_9MICO|nr:GNAT family N-acetyltransferase [Promicromonospora umidemergens]MCP2282002.1 Siderophore synthetase component [Promicromonospora umidemergens]
MSAPTTAHTFTTTTRLGEVTLEPVVPVRDAGLVQGWLSHPAASYWQMAGLRVDEVREYLAGVQAGPHEAAWLGRLDGEPVFLTETYDPARVVLADVHDARPGDLGMHLLVAPPATPRHGLTDAVMTAVMRFCLSGERAAGGQAGGGQAGAGLGATRVVVEPDVGNRKIAAKNAAAGFRVLREIDLGRGAHAKRAALSVATRADFAASALGGGPLPGSSMLATHLTPEHMEPAHRHLVAKTLAELAHERLFQPEPDDAAGSPPDGYRLALDGVTYRFTARRYALEHWVVDPASVRRTATAGMRGDVELPVDALELIAELQPLLQVPDALLATYLEELSATLAAAAAKRERETDGHTPSVRGLLEALRTASGTRAVAESFQQVEAAMSEGHPGFVANNGRIGFSLSDYRAYAPERGRRMRLLWLAARREHTHLALAADQTETGHYGAPGRLGELSDAERAAFADRLAARGLESADYLYLPVHPWQWEHRVAITFAADVARGDLVPLGPGSDEYQPQQSIRTLFNRTRPERHYVKVALAIQNMGFLRGLSPAYMRATPAINDWVADLVAGDETLRGTGFSLLREVASVGYTGDVYHRAPSNKAQPNPHRKMLAALWRESPVPRLAAGERLVTMASLLHRDAAGTSFATALVRESGVPAEQWLRAYLDAYLYPLVHCLLRYELAFMPHGENLMLVLQDGVVRRAIMKDIGEEVVLLGDRPLPDRVERIRAVVDDDEKALAIFTDVFDGVLRHLSGILAEDGVLAEDRFWALVAETIDRHAAEHPGLSSGVDLRAARFAHSCLNRLQLRNTLQMVDLTNQSESLIYAGTLANPAGRQAVR